MGLLKLSWPSVSGKTYRVAYKNDLRATNWTDMITNLTATNTACSWTDATTAGVPKRFYIIVQTN